MGCCNTITKSLIVTTINPIWRSRPVHPGTKNFTICSLRSKENIIFANNYCKKQNTNQASHWLDFILCIFFLSLGLDTSKQSQSILTLIVQTTVSTVLGTFSKQQQGALKVSFWYIFCYTHNLVDLQVCIQQAHASTQNLISVIIACVAVFPATSQYFC